VLPSAALGGRPILVTPPPMGLTCHISSYVCLIRRHNWLNLQKNPRQELKLCKVEFEEKFDNYCTIPHSQISKNAKDARPGVQVVQTLIDLALFKLVAMLKLYDSGDESIYKTPQEKIAIAEA
jgi:hypothetical protein